MFRNFGFRYRLHRVQIGWCAFLGSVNGTLVLATVFGECAGGWACLGILVFGLGATVCK